MKATIEISPEAIAYVFANAFHYEWFRGLRLPKTPQPEVHEVISRTTFEGEHDALPKLVGCGGTVEVQALDPETDKPRWYTVTTADFERACAWYLANTGRYRTAEGLLDGSADVDACDCWLQQAVFGKAVYG
jgi:hypothetical protein